MIGYMPKKYKDIYDQLTKNSRWNGECLESTYKVHSAAKPAYVTHKNKLVSVPRAAWKYHNGEIPKGLFICHRCDNPKCFLIEHLFLGTHTDNMQDMIKKGRDNNWGQRKYSSDTLEKAKQLRQQSYSCKKIAEMLNMTEGAVNSHVTRHKITKGTTIRSPNKFPLGIIEDIKRLRVIGMSDRKIYEKLEMSESTFYRRMRAAMKGI